jgi:hypothetical protein
MHTQNTTRHMIKTSLCIQIVELSIALYSWKAPHGLSKIVTSRACLWTEIIGLYQ